MFLRWLTLPCTTIEVPSFESTPPEFHDVPWPFLNDMIVTGGWGRKSMAPADDFICSRTRSSSPWGAWLPPNVWPTVPVSVAGEYVTWYVVVVNPSSPGTLTSYVKVSVGPLTGSSVDDR